MATNLNSVFRPNRFRLEGGTGENCFRDEQASRPIKCTAALQAAAPLSDRLRQANAAPLDDDDEMMKLPILPCAEKLELVSLKLVTF